MLLFQEKLYKEWPEWLWTVQRALYYGDALFETMRAYDGRVALWPYHWARLERGLVALGFSVPAEWTTDFWQAQLHRVAPMGHARVRLTVWRAPGGLYKPQDNSPHYLLAAQPLPTGWSLPENGLRVGVCKTVQLPMDTLSGQKALNAPRYVAAARDAHAQGWDDALLLNAKGRLCEATSSNLFWWEGDTLFTPPLSEGCVAGVMRQFLLDTYPSIVEAVATQECLQAAHAIALTNAVRGIVPVVHWGDRHFDDTLVRDFWTKNLTQKVFK